MKKNRVNCINCIEFIPPDFKNSLYIIPLKMTKKAKCKKGKRVMFRQPKDFYDGGGWFRYCDEYNDKNILSTITNLEIPRGECVNDYSYNNIIKTFHS
jgi:hypothetical protein